jgi:sodium/proline symporter
MYIYEVSAMVIYFILLLIVGYFSYRKHLSASDFIIGDRSMNYWLTALAAHASDMSSWLFMAYPASIFMKGFMGTWTAIGLTVCMFLNWRFIAPKIRVATEQYGSLTFSSFFESRLADTTGLIRIFSAIILVIFYTIYLAAQLYGLGELLNVLFNIDFTTGVTIGILIVIPYVFTGGFRTLAWIDLFQGLFLMCVIIAVPLYLLPKVGGIAAIAKNLSAENLSTSLFPNFGPMTLLSIVSMAFGWGLGYFGQPHIVTKFMGINNVSEISKSKWIGMSWMVLSLSAATLVGLVGLAYFNGKMATPELVFIEMVKGSFHPFMIGLILCAVLATTINAMSSQVLVLSSSLTEDFYKRLVRKTASSKELLFISRIGVVLVSIIAFMIALKKTSTIYTLVEYAWSGIGSSFGPLVIFSLYSKKVNRFGAWAGILTGGIVAGVWPYFNKLLGIDHISPMLPGFLGSVIAILLVSKITKNVTTSR